MEVQCQSSSRKPGIPTRVVSAICRVAGMSGSLPPHSDWLEFFLHHKWKPLGVCSHIVPSTSVPVDDTKMLSDSRGPGNPNGVVTNCHLRRHHRNRDRFVSRCLGIGRRHLARTLGSSMTNVEVSSRVQRPGRRGGVHVRWSRSLAGGWKARGKDIKKGYEG